MKIEEQNETTDKSNNISKEDKKSRSMVLAAFMIFIFPILSIFLGALLGGYIGKVAGISIILSQIIGGAVGFAIAAIIIKSFDRHTIADEDTEKIHWDDL